MLKSQKIIVVFIINQFTENNCSLHYKAYDLILLTYTVIPFYSFSCLQYFKLSNACMFFFVYIVYYIGAHTKIQFSHAAIYANVIDVLFVAELR